MWNIGSSHWPGNGHMQEDKGLARAIQCLVGNGSLVDVGAGAGQYGAFFAKCAPPRVQWTGFDGAPTVEKLSASGPPGAFTRHANLCTANIDLGLHDWVMSLEVGEHLPQWCLANFIATLDRSNRLGMIISWAPPWSKGIGHVNGRNRSHVIAMAEFLGYRYSAEVSLVLRLFAGRAWLRQDVAAFFRPSTPLPSSFWGVNGWRRTPTRHGCPLRKFGETCATVASKCACPFAMSRDSAKAGTS